MRKILPLMLCVSLLLCATACFRSKVDESLPQGTASSKQSTTTSASSTTSSSSTGSTSATASTASTSATASTASTSASATQSTDGSATTTTTLPPAVGENPTTFPWIGTITSVDGVNVRSEPDSSDYDNVIASGMYGDRVKVIGQEGQWYKVMWEFGSDDIREAYVSAQFVQYFSEVNP